MLILMTMTSDGDDILPEGFITEEGFQQYITDTNDMRETVYLHTNPPSKESNHVTYE